MQPGAAAEEAAKYKKGVQGKGDCLGAVPNRENVARVTNATLLIKSHPMRLCCIRDCPCGLDGVAALLDETKWRGTAGGLWDVRTATGGQPGPLGNAWHQKELGSEFLSFQGRTQTLGVWPRDTQSREVGQARPELLTHRNSEKNRLVSVWGLPFLAWTLGPLMTR